MVAEKEALEMISNLENYALENGREANTWHLYEDHVLNVAKVAKILAGKLGLDENKAYLMGLLHDIGKIEEEKTKRFHGIIGYEMFIEKDKDIARACLLHMFPNNVITEKQFFGKREDYEFTLNFAKNTSLSDYDNLICLADSLGAYDGFITIEERAIDAIRRRNLDSSPEFLQKVIEPYIKIKQYFDEKLNDDVYKILGIYNK
ncbi:MAG: HD domain-containing protein [Alphaproteobacteria bacterium]